MGVFDKIFGTKAERAERKAEKVVAKADSASTESRRINDANIKIDAANFASKAQKELDYKRNVMKAKGALKNLEDETRASLILAINKLQNEESKGEYRIPADVELAKRNMKNIFYRLVTIKRNQKTLEQAEINHRWNESMNELNNAYKLINIVNGCEDNLITNKVKLLVFRYRRKKVEKVDDMPYEQLRKYFGKEAETDISDEVYNDIAKRNIVDLMVDDVLFDKLVNAAAIDKCLIDPEINKIYPDEMAEEILKVNAEAQSAGDPPPVEEIKNESYTFEDSEKLEEMAQGLFRN